MAEDDDSFVNPLYEANPDPDYNPPFKIGQVINPLN